VMEPLETNSPSLDPRLRRAFGQILEFDHGTSLGQGRDGVLRPFVYVNHANMGLFTAADAQPGVPDIAATREYRTKEGLGVSWDQALSPDWGVFTRLSWNDGHTEDIAYSEIDRSAAAGVSLKGTSWSRPDDAVGVAGALDGLASEHKKYLERGGIGFVIGDGALSYAPEEIVEAYYSLRLCKWLSLSPDFQYIEHPGYNSARGGVAVYAVRAHLEF